MTSKAPKGDLYARELDIARLRGEWVTELKLTGGQKVLPWSELIRKYMKHNPNEQTIPSVASLEQQIRSSLINFWRQEDYSDVSHSSDSAQPHSIGSTAFPPPLPINQFGKGWSGEGVTEATKRLGEFRSAARDETSKFGIAAIQAYALFSTGQDEEAVELLHDVRYLDEVNVNKFKTGQTSEEYASALILMGFVVYGLANERLQGKRQDHGYNPFAFAGYARAIDLHEGLRGGQKANALRGLPADEIERWGETALYRNALFSVRNGDLIQGLNALRAYQANAGRWPANFREPQRDVIYRTYLKTLNRAVETGGYVAPSSAPQRANQNEDCRTSAYQQGVIASLASRVEIRDFESERAPRHGQARRMVGVDAKGITSRTTSNRRPAPHRQLRPFSATWSNELLTVQKAAATSISRSTKFPRAGRVNETALELADELVRGWKLNGEQGGDYADEVIEILYVLSRVTFLSQSISRHLFTLLSASENYEEARKALVLYIQIFEKAREGDAADSAGLVEESKRREAKQIEEGDKQEGQGEGGEEINGDRSATNKEPMSEGAKEQAQKVHLDSDSDEDFVNTLLHGSHVYCRYMDDAEGGDKLARKAIEFVAHEKRKYGLASNNALMARVKRAAGVARAAYCHAVADPVGRPAWQSEALTLLQQSSSLDPESSETFYNLAVLHAEMRDVPAAIKSARRALELEPADMQTWHLLTLLVSAQKDFKGALRLAEEGLAEAEDDDEADMLAALKGIGKGQGKGEAVVNGGPPQINGLSLSTPSPSTSVSRTTLLSVDYPSRYRERAEAILRLMMTHNALEEVVEGGEAAIEGQREIFEFFHKRVATTTQAAASQRQMPSATSQQQIGTTGGVQSNGSVSTRSATRSATRGRLSTILSSSGQKPKQFDSPTGLGQSGAATLNKGLDGTSAGLQQRRAASVENGAVSSVAVPPVPIRPVDDDDVDDGGAVATAAFSGVRQHLHYRQETSLLSDLWLMAAASFRRAGKLDECRVAIQEAERVDPAKADVWLQLALWFEASSQRQQSTKSTQATDSINLAINCLYKALACREDHVASAVHLARLFLDHGKSSAAARQLMEKHQSNASASKTETRHGITKLAGQAYQSTQSRSIVATPSSTEATRQGTGPVFFSESELRAKAERDRLSSLGLAEGLLNSVTTGKGWNCAEAWLFLGKVGGETSRPERQRQCLQYALDLERTKGIRDYRLGLNER